MRSRSVAPRSRDSHASSGDGAGPPSAEPVFDLLAGAWWGAPWFAWWSQAWQAWLTSATAWQPGAASAEATTERRKAVAPWVPQFEATVIPFRRRDDAAGTEATRLSMRMHVPTLPWLGSGGNVIAVDTLVPGTLPHRDND